MSHYVDSQVVEGLLTNKSWNTNVLITTVASGTLSLTNASETMQVFQGTTSGQIVKMPDCTTFAQIGQRYQLHNDSTQNVTVQDNASGALFLLEANKRAFLTCVSVGSAAGSWSYFLVEKTIHGDPLLVTYPGTGLTVNYASGVARFNGVTTLISAGSIPLTASQTAAWLYVDLDGAVKQSASLPSGTMAMALYTTSPSAVTSLTDEREVVDQNTVWGVDADVQPIRYNSTQGAGNLEKAARANHTHAATLPLYKSGQLANTAFAAANPRVATVTFGTAFPGTSYNVTVTGTDGRSWIVTNIVAGSFVINTQAAQALTGPVYWTAVYTGESL